MRIAGVLDSSELAVYCDEMTLAKYEQERNALSHAKPGSDYGIAVNPGEVIVALKYGETEDMPAIGEKILMQGEEFEVSSFLSGYERSYSEWLNNNGVKKQDFEAYFRNLTKTEFPELTEGSAAFESKCAELSNLCYADYWEYYYDRLEDFMKNLYMFYPDTFDLWLYFEKDCTEARYSYTDWEYYAIYQYEELYGKTPTAEELQGVIDQFHGVDLIEYYARYEQEFYSIGFHPMERISYLLSDEDYLLMSKRVGESHPHASTLGEGEDFFAYTAIHSTNPKVTEAWLLENFSSLDVGAEFMHAVLTPDLIFDNIIYDHMQSITGGLVTIGLILAVMSVCMYFIMRSSLMSRIKEVGIYRAIGVSKRNLVFKFLTEAFVLATLTVFLGYLATSAFIFLCMNASPLVAEIFYYPPWVAGVVLAVLYALSLICGIIPILSLLRKTPSEILAKYDI
ncbi:MAG: ABC transporter permease, partial [Clostridia bacterium]|nr:ABC transporter permease [Clostridia bacterium]